MKNIHTDLSNIEKKIAAAITEIPENPGWNLFRIFEIHGVFSVTCFRQALRALCREHEILRTRFVQESGTWRRVIEDDLEIPLEIHRIREANPERRIRSVQQILIEWQRRPIRLDAPAPYGFAGVITTGWNHRFVMVRISHAIFDGISSSIILHELLRLYLKQMLLVSLLPTRRSSPPSVYPQWQQEQSKRQPEAIQFWEGINQRFTPTILPVCVPDPIPSDTLAGIRRLRYSKESLGGLQTLRRQFRMTESFFLLTVFQLALYTESATSEISVRLTSSNRSRGDIEHTIGMFANGLPFTATVDEEKTYLEWTRSLRELYSNSLRWGYVYPESEDRLPFILFNYYHSSVDEFYSRKLSFGIGSVTIRTDLVPFHMFSFHALLLIARDMGREIEFFLLYRNAWYSDEIIDRFMDRFIRLIRWVMQHPNVPLREGLHTITDKIDTE